MNQIVLLADIASPGFAGAEAGQVRIGVYSGKLQVPYEAFAAGLGDHRIVATPFPGGKERMRRPMEAARQGRVDLTPLRAHTFPLDRIAEAHDLFGARREGVLKVAIRPWGLS